MTQDDVPARYYCRFGYMHAVPSLATCCTVHDPDRETR